MYSVFLWKCTFISYLYLLRLCYPVMCDFNFCTLILNPLENPQSQLDVICHKKWKNKFSFFSEPYLTSKLFECPNKYIKSHYIRLFTQSTIYGRDVKLILHIEPHIHYCNLKCAKPVKLHDKHVQLQKKFCSSLPCTVMIKYRFCSFKENFFFSCLSVNWL